MAVGIFDNLEEKGIEPDILNNHLQYDLLGNYQVLKNNFSIKEAMKYMHNSVSKIIDASKQNKTKRINNVLFYDIWS